ncbi:MAG TPA: hypothetical protein VHI12_01340 [Gaiellaceae bacterium]|jgi:uncharacterized phage infection (PIP) family protein YhgE|nr:hypothetical protein [Gaiellaceae bacterium]
MTRKLLASGTAALALVAAGCGGGDESSASPTEEWANSFCTAITTWKDSLTSVTEQFSSLSSLTSEALTDAANDAKSSTETFVDELRALGPPETESGEAVKSSIDELSNTVESEVAKIESTAEGVSGLADLPSAITSITTSISAMSSAVSSTAQTAESADTSGELRTALEDTPACADISS